MEQWRTVEEDKRYKVSYLGRIAGINGEILKPSLDTNGYPQVKINNKTVCVHTLVAKAYCANLNGYKEVNHIDEVKLHNFAFNLEWCTRVHNIECSLCYYFTVVSPDGTEYTARNQSRFAREHGLHPRTFRKLVAGTVYNHKGWRKIK